MKALKLSQFIKVSFPLLSRLLLTTTGYLLTTLLIPTSRLLFPLILSQKDSHSNTMLS